MAAGLFTNGTFQAFDSNGDPLSSGKLYTYAAGTTTNQATYTTQALNVANANPVVLDSNGRAAVWLDSSLGNYKMVLKDSADVTIWTTDEIATVVSGISDIVSDTSPQLGGMLDVNGNSLGDGTLELLTFTEDSSAVNHINIENQATGSGPIISAAGDDTNIDLHLGLKGTGALIVDGTADTAAEIRLAEDTDNGTNYMGIKAPASVSSSTTLTLPDGDGSANQILQTDGAGTLSWGSSSVPGWTEVASTTASGSANITFTGLTTYKEYKVQFEAILPATDDVGLNMDVSVDNGCTYISTATYHSTLGVGGSTMQLLANQGNAASEELYGYIHIKSRNTEGSEYGLMDWFVRYENASGTAQVEHYHGWQEGLSTSDIDAIRFSHSSGNIASGTMRLFGR